MRRHIGEQPFDMRARVNKALFARARCAAVQPALSRSAEVTASRPDVAPVLSHQPNGRDRFRCNRAGIGDHDLAIRSRTAQPIGAVDDLLT